MTRHIFLFISCLFFLENPLFSKNTPYENQISSEKSELISKKSSNNNVKSTQQLYKEAEKIKFVFPDSATSLYQYSISEAIKSKDSLQWIKSLTGLAYLYAHNGEFGNAYDGYWEALGIADEYNDDLSRVNIYNGLGWLYSFYERTELSYDYFNKAVTILKANKDLPRFILIDNYFAIATTARKEGEYDMARNYLDSCKHVKQTTPELVDDNNNFINAEYGYILYGEEEYEEALKVLLPLDTFFTTKQHSYLVIYHYFLGNVYKQLNDYKKSEKYYESAIFAGIKHKSHSDRIPLIYEAYSYVLQKNNKLKEAYKMLKISKDLNEKQYGSRQISNKKFLEIKDQFRKKQQQQKELLQKQELERLQQESKINYLRNIIFYVTIGGLVLVVFFVYRNLRNKFKAKQMIFIETQRLEEEKIQEVLEIKNKELTSSVLQIIQHEETLAEIKKELMEQKKKPDANQLGKLAKKINLNTNNNWKEFEARFVEVNKNFYQELNQRFPNLTQGDQKICALIKLNFDSKGMSKLLGISTESVHTTRYRLRKKLGLSRQDNLEEFICLIG
ncbi:tetratricopeptide repeat protein [Flammeovirga sp. MY04]|uniref:tetratricopeptide repeat protein n=1 Tax=Flammeovirga sp. MY04 TaxID=1191459 RepID=UPI00080632C0|nr:tetratricopeptide repeat protein [Flammeovirga sp. MY04]ANQ52851.1 tetratricopeptide repeat protein [Flammeovirga sp. MY04]